MNSKDHHGTGPFPGAMERAASRPCRKCGGRGYIHDPATKDPPHLCPGCPKAQALLLKDLDARIRAAVEEKTERCVGAIKDAIEQRDPNILSGYPGGVTRGMCMALDAIRATPEDKS